MKKGIWTWLIISMALTLHARALETGSSIEIHMYNYAHIPAKVVAGAEEEMARIYRVTGIDVGWRNCLLSVEALPESADCDAAPTTTRFNLRLLSATMAQALPLKQDIYGFALLSVSGGFGVVANVFADRARDMPGYRESPGVFLGALIAHEIGHLLLNEAGHPAAAGVMHIPWQTKELERIRQGTLLFLPAQGERMRAQILARTSSRANVVSSLGKVTEIQA